jgi:hypothetical protein
MTELLEAAQTSDEVFKFVEAFAKVGVKRICAQLGSPMADAAIVEATVQPDWDADDRIALSGLAPQQIDASARAGNKYLHIDVAMETGGRRARQFFLAMTGFSDKQQRLLFPLLRSRAPSDEQSLAPEVARLNTWLDEVRSGGFDPAAFVIYQRSIGIHGSGQNLSGAIGAAGASIAFLDAIEEASSTAITDTVGQRAPPGVRSPAELQAWLAGGPDRVLRAVLLSNGRALVFASSKDANIFEPLGAKPFINAADALARFNAVATDQRERAQRLHEHAVGEVKTATDPANLHERLGLASRETQTELRTDRFLMMALLTPDFLAGGVQRRTINNRDLTRFSHVFNLHHCWGWDGGRNRHPEHWAYFRDSLAEWCGL